MLPPLNLDLVRACLMSLNSMRFWMKPKTSLLMNFWFVFHNLNITIVDITVKETVGKR
jgi:hypothetical protein